MPENIMDKSEKRKLYFSIYDDVTFSSARILNLIHQIELLSLNKFLGFEDLNYIDFFASHPFLIFEPNQKEYLDLKYYGFSENSLEYINSKQIFSNQREKLKTVITYLISKDLIKPDIEKKIIVYHLTEIGRKIMSYFSSDYYFGYRKSASHILNILKRLSLTEKNQYIEIWLDNSTKFVIP